MARLHVGVSTLVNVRPHPYADALDLANIDTESGYQVVLRRDAFKSGDRVVYIPEGAKVPVSILEELGLVGKLSAKTKDVVRAVRLRGEISQGLVWRPEKFDQECYATFPLTCQNLADQFGITKYVPEIPVHMAGEHEAAPDLLGWVEIENIKKYPKVLTEGEPVVITEKLHGTCAIFCLQVEEDLLQVSSKGLAAQYLALKESDGNLYWRVAKAYKIKEVLRYLAGRMSPKPTRVAVYGEVYGEGVQDLTYGASARSEVPGFAAFDARATTETTDTWLRPYELRGLLPTVPVLYAGPYSREVVEHHTDGLETVSRKGHHLREGVVIRPQIERLDPGMGGRVILKSVSEAYLTRKKGDQGVVGEPSELQ